MVLGDLDWSVPRTRQYTRPPAGILFHAASGSFQFVAVVVGLDLNGPVGDDNDRSTAKMSLTPPSTSHVKFGGEIIVLPFMGETRVMRVSSPCPFTTSVTGIC